MISSTWGFNKWSISFGPPKSGTCKIYAWFGSIGIWLSWGLGIYTAIFMNYGSWSGSPFPPGKGWFWTEGMNLIGTIVSMIFYIYGVSFGLFNSIGTFMVFYSILVF